MQVSDVFQYMWSQLLGKHVIAPQINASRTWEGLIGGVLSTMLAGGHWPGAMPAEGDWPGDAMVAGTEPPGTEASAPDAGAVPGTGAGDTVPLATVLAGEGAEGGP